jgi:hypothetical protein
MSRKETSTIDLGVTRIIPLLSPIDGTFSIELLSADLSADTTFFIEQSVSGTNWAAAKEAGTAISETLVQSTVFVDVYEIDKYNEFRIRFDGATTGNIAYTIGY